MKKKTMFMIALGAILSIGAMTYLTSFKETEHVHTHTHEVDEVETTSVENTRSNIGLSTFGSEGNGKTKVEFTIGKETGINGNGCFFESSLGNTFSRSISSNDNGGAGFTFYYNNKEITGHYLVADSSGSITFPWGDYKIKAQRGGYSGDSYYDHYQIKKGTTVFTTATTDYVLAEDYNFWGTRGQSLGFSYLFQNGGSDGWGNNKASKINSLEFPSFSGGIQEWAHRFLVTPGYNVTTSYDWGSNSGFENYRCPIYINKNDGNGYVLSDSSATTPVILSYDVDSANNTKTFYLIMQYGQLFGAENSSKSFDQIKLSSSYYSYYIPKGTLWGGLDYPFMITDDYYFEITNEPVNDSYAHGFYTSAHEYTHHDAKDPTCTEKGNKEYWTCRDTHVKEHGYKYFTNAEGTVGTTWDQLEIAIDSTKHSVNKVAAVASKNDKHGTIEYYQCEYCNTRFFDEAHEHEITSDDQLIAHNLVKNDAVPATCERTGNSEYYTCTVCLKYFVKDGDDYKETTWNDIRQKGDHYYGAEIAEVAATETKHGVKAHYKCSQCSKLFVKENNKYVEVTEEALVLHNLKDVPAKEGTCTEAGNIEYYECTCEGCGKLYKKDASGNLVEISESDTKTAGVHDYGTEIAEVAATENKHGTKAHYKCSKCSKLFVKEGSNYVEATEESLVLHNLKDVEAKEPTCTEDGNKAYSKCTCEGCNKVFVKDEAGKLVETTLSDVTIPAAHKYGEEITEVAATETKHGMKAHYQCSECSKFFVKEGEEYVEVTEESLYLHNVSEVKAKDATCTEDGNKAYYKCTCEGCDKVFTKDASGNLVEVSLSDVTTKATGHTYGDWTFDEVNLKITHTCKTCNHTETIDVNEANGFTYKVVTEPTSSSEGKATWTSAKYGTFTVTLPKVAGSNNTGLIVGISAGAAVVLVGGGTGLYFLLKKKH